MVFGDPISERIQLNDDSLWPKDLNWEHPDGRPADLKEIRKLLIDGNIQAVDSLLVQKFSRKTVVRSYQSLGDLFINLDHTEISNYKRSLNLTNEIIDIQYLPEEYNVFQSADASNP